jgi:hypothetical protein
MAADAPGLYLEVMVTRRARSFLTALLAFALLPIVSVAGVGATQARAHAAMAWMQWTARAQSAVQQSTHARLGEIATHHPAATPFAAAEPLDLRARASASAPVLVATPVTAASASVTLHPARGPPALL